MRKINQIRKRDWGLKYFNLKISLLDVLFCPGPYEATWKSKESIRLLWAFERSCLYGWDLLNQLYWERKRKACCRLLCDEMLSFDQWMEYMKLELKSRVKKVSFFLWKHEKEPRPIIKWLFKKDTLESWTSITASTLGNFSYIFLRPRAMWPGNHW